MFLNPEFADLNESAQGRRWVRETYRYGKGKKMILGPRGQSQRVIIPSDYENAFENLLSAFTN